jgi:hypothetical protein
MHAKVSFFALILLSVFLLARCANSPSSTHSVTFTVTATNGVTVAEDINYLDTSLTLHTFNNVSLPWTLTVTLPVSSDQNTVGLYAQAESPADNSSTLTGTVTDDGVQVRTQSDPKSDGVYMSIGFETLI